MIFRKKVNAALQLLGYLHSNERGSPISLAEAAHEIGISLSYAELIISVLSKANLVKGQRGPGGGYSLIIRPASEMPNYTSVYISRLTELFYPGFLVSGANNAFTTESYDTPLSSIVEL